MSIPPPPRFSVTRPSVPPRCYTRRDVLRECYLPADILVIDFETFFSTDYHMGRDSKALSTIEFVQDPRFEVVGCGFLRVPKGVDRPDYENETIFQVGEEMVATQIKCYQKLYGDNFERCTVIAQNAVFDCCVLSRRYGINPPHIIDILGLARHWHSRSNNDLAALCKRHGLKAKGETEDFKNYTFRSRFAKATGRGKNKIPIQLPMFTPEKIAALADYGSNDVKREWELLEILLPKLSNPTVEIPLMNHTLNLFLKPTLEINYDKATELQVAMSCEIGKSIDKICALIGEVDPAIVRKQISGDLSFSRLIDQALEDVGDTPQRYYKPGARGYILAIAKTDNERELLEKHASERVRDLMAARIGLETWPKHIQRINKLCRMAQCEGGKLPIPLKYSGAHTGRWSGADGVNPQNMGTRGHELVNAVRGIIVAPSGHVMPITDASQIEARGTAWIAGQDDMCAAFRDQDANPQLPYDVYTSFASKALGWTVRKPKKTGGIPEIEAKMKWARQAVGKIPVLGCIAAGTKVLTDGGWKPIEQVEIWDKVWDGEAFVDHDGVVYQGDKECVYVNGVWMTPDHEVLTDGGWIQGQYLNTRHRKSGRSTGNSRLRALRMESAAGLSPSNVVASVVELLLRTETTLSLEILPDVMFVLKQRLLFAIPDMAQCNPRIVSDFLIEFVRSLGDAVIRRINSTEITGVAESESTALGFVIDDVFLNTWLNFRDGTNLSLKLTGSTTTKDTYRRTLDSLRGQNKTAIVEIEIPEEKGRKPNADGASVPLNDADLINDSAENDVLALRPTYDIVRAGPNRRYQANMLIVANCGYGMGATKLETYAANMGVEFTTEFAEHLVTTYRRENAKIVQFWYDIERAFVYTARYKAPCDLPRGLHFYSTSDCDVLIRLPNTRELKYHNVRLETQGRKTVAEIFNDQTKSWEYTWGGALTENVVQAVSRDILAEAMLRCESRGIHTALHCHDELVPVVPTDTGDTALKICIEELSRVPTWAVGWPLAAEGLVRESYGAH